MNKRINTLLLFCIIMMILSFGCSKISKKSSTISESSTSSSSVVVSTSSELIVSSSIVPHSEQVTPISPLVSPTTGKSYSTDKMFYPIMVTIENASGARPQTGLNKTDIIYEFPVESTITRFLCIYNDTLPTVVGPVRSARYYFYYTQKEWDSIYVHFGGAGEEDSISIYNKKYNWTKVDIDGMLGKYGSYFWRDNSRKAPHNAYTDLVSIKTKYPDYKSNRDYFCSFSDSPSFSDISAKKIHIPFASTKKPNVEFVYDETTKLYTRYENGIVFKSVETNDEGKTTQEVVTTRNVIVQYVPMETIHTTHYNRRKINMIGSGDAEFFINGKYIHGKWERKGEDDYTLYYDDFGKEIVLGVGSTWIAIQPDWYNVTFS